MALREDDALIDAALTAAFSELAHEADSLHQLLDDEAAKPEPPPIDCGKMANGYPCFLPAGHATPRMPDAPCTIRSYTDPAEAAKWPNFGCMGRKPR